MFVESSATVCKRVFGGEIESKIFIKNETVLISNLGYL